MKQTPQHRQATAGAKRLLWILPLLGLLAAATFAIPGFSSAAFTARTLNGSSTVSAASDWTAPTVTVRSPGDLVRGTVTVTVDATDADSGIRDVVIQHRAQGANSWTTLCTDATAPYSCSLDTTTLPNGAHDLRAIATDNAANSATSAAVRITIDNAAPTVTMENPGSPLSGTKTFTATSTDTHSGVAEVVIQSSPNGTTWSELCRVTTAPYSCSYDTSRLADGTYSFRAVSTDKAGNSATSAVVANRVVSNTVLTVTLADPGSYLHGTVTVNASATASQGVKNVAIQRSAAGANSWTTICTDTSAPYSCAFNTTGVTDGLYDLRAVVTDNQNKTATSNVVTNRRVDNASPAGVDVQAQNGGSAGRFDAGDTITLSYGSQLALASLTSGWDGSPMAIRLNLANTWFGSSSLSFARTDGGAVNLGSLMLDAKFTFLTSATFDGTMVATTTTVNGVPRTVVTVTVGEQRSGSSQTDTGNATMEWSPSTSATGLNGKSVSGATVVESGAADRDF